MAMAVGLRPWHAVAGEIPSRRGGYAVDVGILYDVFSFQLTGRVEETIDRSGGRYEVTVVGEGGNIANRLESRGRVHGGRWAPLHSVGWFQVRGRESRSEVSYDHVRRTVDYRFRGETFFRRRLRVVDDRVSWPEDVHVDDVMSALLNYGDGFWKPRADGIHHTSIVRRRKRDGEGPDDVDPNARAELVPFRFRVLPEGTTGKTVAAIDLTPFSSWAHPDRPGRIVFGRDRRPELITASLMLGTSVTIRLGEA